MKRKFRKKSIDFNVIQEIIEFNKSKKRKNREIINENFSFIQDAKAKHIELEEDPSYIPKKKINEVKREKVIDILFNEREEVIIEKPKTDEKFKTISKLFETKENKIFLEKTNDSFVKRIIDIIDEPVSNFIFSKLSQVYNYIDSKIQKLTEDISTSKQIGKNMIPMGGIFIDRTSGNIISPNPQSGNPNILILNDGIQLDTKATSMNFIGVGVKVYSDGNGNINVFIPPTLLSPYFNSGAALINPESTVLRNIAFPTTEGNPFNRGSIIGQFETTNDSILSFTTINPFSILNNTSTELTIRIFDANETTLIASLSQIITGDFDTGIISGLRIQLNSFINEANKFSGIANFYIDLNTILNGNSGKITIELEHNNLSDGIYTFEQTLFYDSETLDSSIQSISISENTPIVKYLSGIRYYTNGSNFNINVINISNHNSDSYPNEQLRITSYNLSLPITEYTGSQLQNYNTQYDNNGVNLSDILAINAINYRYRGTQARVSARILDWIPENEIFSSNMFVLIDTYGNTSSQFIRTFDDEIHRLESDYITSWNSMDHLTASEAMVFDGFLMCPNRGYLSDLTNNNDWTGYNPISGQPNYNSLISLPVSYFTKFDDDSIDKSSFSITFEGEFVIDALSDLLNEHLRIFIRRVDGNGNFGVSSLPLRLHGGYYNFSVFDDGLTTEGSRITEGSSSANVINATFGGLSCRNGIYMEIQINHINIKIDTITLEFF